MKCKILFFICCSLFFINKGRAQVTVSSSDTVSCRVPCTTLYANVVGDTPTDAGVTEDDVYSRAIPIGFTFNYYGINYTSCELGANGTIDFNAADAGMYDPWPITAALAGNTSKYNNICGPWCDIDIFYTGTPVGSEKYSTDGVAPYRKFVVTWCGCSMYQCPDQLTTSQIILYETTNVIEVHVAKKEICTSWNPDSPPGAGGRAIIGVEGPESMGGPATVAPGRDWTPVWSALDEAWRFSPMDTSSTTPVYYTVSSIPYAPIPFAINPDSVYWYSSTGGPYTYLATGDSVTVCPATTTTYRAGKLGCADTSFGYYTIVNNALSVTAIGANPSRCGASDGSILLTGLIPGDVDTVNYLYNGSPAITAHYTVSASGTITLAGLLSGVYSNITVTQLECISAPQVITLVNPPISISSVNIDNPTACYLQNGDLVLNGLYGGVDYTVTFDSAGIILPPRVLAANSTGSVTIPNLGPGTYNNIVATITDATPDSCVTPPMGPYTLIAPPPPDGIISATLHPSKCGSSDGSITLMSFPPFGSDTVNYTYNGTPQTAFTTSAGGDSSIYLPGLPGGTYSGITVTVGQCIYTVTGSATIDSPVIQASFDTSIHLGCHGDTVYLSNTTTSYFAGAPVAGAGPYYYTWLYDDGTAPDTSASPDHIFATQGTYTVTLVVNNRSCWDTVSIPITLFHPLFDSFIAAPPLVCQDSFITFTNYSFGTPGQPIYYNWYFGDGSTDTSTNPTHAFPVSGTYDVILVAHDYVPCYDTFSVAIQSDTLSNVNVLATDTVICQGTDITFNGLYAALGNTGVTWYFGNGDSIQNVNPITYAYNSTGTFTLTSKVYYRACGLRTSTRTITVEAQPVINLGPDTSICAGSGSITLTDNLYAAAAGVSFLWSTGQTTPAITITTPGTYYATVSLNNCSATDSVVVSNDCYMDIPNVFTPNHDGVNDFFYPRQFLSKGLIAFKMDIYNRWGQLIFETTSLDGQGWDGKLNGTDQPNGVYIYVINGTFKDGQKQNRQGNVTLMR
jgi:gliding motility-associated-like protein